MNNYKNNAKISWGLFVCGFWIRVARIGQIISVFAIRRSIERCGKNAKLVNESLSEEFSEGFDELNKIMEKL